MTEDRPTGTYKYLPQGTCSREIEITISDGVIDEVRFTGGCNGNLQGLSALVRGMRPYEVIERLHGIKCGNKATSCPDQLARALSSIAPQ